MKKIWILMALMGSAQAAELRIYPTFAEIVEPVEVKNGQVVFTLNNMDLCQVVPRSLQLQNIQVHQHQVVQQVTSKKPELQGVTVGVQTEEGFRMGTLVSLDGAVGAEVAWIQDAKSGWFFSAPLNKLQFQQKPPALTTTVKNEHVFTFDVAPPAQGVPVLSRYLSKAVSWSPSYTLNIQGNKATLQGWAELNNRTSQTWNAEHLKLFGGDIKTTFKPDVNCTNGLNRNVISGYLDTEMPLDVQSRITRPEVQNAEAVSGGVYMHEVNRPVVIPAMGKLSVAVQDMELAQVSEMLVHKVRFSLEASKGNMRRQYVFVAPEFLMGGMMQIRSDDFFIGEVPMGSASKGAKVTLDMGLTSEVTYERKVLVVDLKKDQQSNTIKDVYQVSLTFKNTSDREVQVDYQEDLYASRQILKFEAVDASLWTSNDQVGFQQKLGPRQQKTVIFSFSREY